MILKRELRDQGSLGDYVAVSLQEQGQVHQGSKCKFSYSFACLLLPLLRKMK